MTLAKDLLQSAYRSQERLGNKAAKFIIKRMKIEAKHGCTSYAFDGAELKRLFKKFDDYVCFARLREKGFFVVGLTTFHQSGYSPTVYVFTNEEDYLKKIGQK